MLVYVHGAYKSIHAPHRWHLPTLDLEWQAQYAFLAAFPLPGFCITVAQSIYALHYLQSYKETDIDNHRLHPENLPSAYHGV